MAYIIKRSEVMVYGYKKVYLDRNKGLLHGVVLKLLIPKGQWVGAHEHRGRMRKLRTDFAIPIQAYNLAGREIKETEFISGWNFKFKYRIGEIVTPKPEFCMFDAVCAAGIHFYLSFNEAKRH